MNAHAASDPLLTLANRQIKVADEEKRCLLRIIDLRLRIAVQERSTLAGLQESIRTVRDFIGGELGEASDA